MTAIRQEKIRQENTRQEKVRQEKIRQEKIADFDAREALLDRAYGPSRFTKTSQSLRQDRLPASGLSFVATDDGDIVGSVRLWNVQDSAGKEALLLGPLAVAPEHRSNGLGGRLMKHAISVARMRGHGAILLVGDAPYYERFGFSADQTGSLAMPGAYDQHRLLGLELRADALAGAQGLISATGRFVSKPDLHEQIATSPRAVKSPTSRAA